MLLELIADPAPTVSILIWSIRSMSSVCLAQLLQNRRAWPLSPCVTSDGMKTEGLQRSGPVVSVVWCELGDVDSWASVCWTSAVRGFNRILTLPWKAR